MAVKLTIRTSMMIIISFTGKDGVANETDPATELLKLYASAEIQAAQYL